MANKYKIVLMVLAMTSSCVALKAQTEDLEKLLDAGNKPQNNMSIMRLNRHVSSMGIRWKCLVKVC